MNQEDYSMIDQVKIFEQNILLHNQKQRDFWQPLPLPINKMKVAFSGYYSEYIKSEYNITEVKANSKAFKIQLPKILLAVQLYYKYFGCNEPKIYKEVVSLYFVDRNHELIHISRDW